MNRRIRVVLDTHTLVWLKTDPSRLSSAQVAAVSAIEEQGDLLGISAISLWEMAMLIDRRRIDCPQGLRAFLQEVVDDDSIAVCPVDVRVAAESVAAAPGFPSDPSDRLIAATARVLGVALATADRNIRASGWVGVI